MMDKLFFVFMVWHGPVKVAPKHGEDLGLVAVAHKRSLQQAMRQPGRDIVGVLVVLSRHAKSKKKE